MCEVWKSYSSWLFVFDISSQDENDDNYELEQDAGDEFDSDFGEDVRSLLILIPLSTDFF